MESKSLVLSLRALHTTGVDLANTTKITALVTLLATMLVIPVPITATLIGRHLHLFWVLLAVLGIS